MDRNEFLSRIFKMFSNFNDSNVEFWKPAYEEVLTEPNIDYEKLFKLMVTNWEQTYSAPAPKHFKGWKQDCIPKDDRCDALKNIEQMRENAAPPSPDVLARIEAMRKKMRAV